MTLPESQSSLTEIALIFLRFGVTAFGGPAAHIAMFHDEFVKRRKWLTDEHFLDLLGATNLIPGPSSTEMTMHIGHLRAGWRGLFVAGFCFILPAALIVMGLAALYDQYGTTPAADWLLYAIKPVVVAVILQAIWMLGQKAVKTALLGVIGAAVLVLYLFGINELLLLFGGALLVMLLQNFRTIPNTATLLLFSFPVMQRAVETTEPVTLSQLFLTFFKIGSVLYGSGYVLLAFLKTDFIDRLGWLTEQQLLDAVAIGQFTPGPLFTTATFIGYLTGQVPGAILATIGIFLPGFFLVLLTNPLIPRMRQWRWTSSLLDGVNVAAIGLMVGVTVELGQAAIIDLFTLGLSVGAAVLLIRYKVNSTWLILGAGIIGMVYKIAVG